MKKQLLLMLGIAGLTFSACEKKSQAYFSLTPPAGQTLTSSVSSLSIDFKTAITNTTNQPVSYTWKKTRLAMPSNWYLTICDPVQCWATESNNFTLAPNATDTITVKFYPMWTVGLGNLSLEVTKTDDPSTIQVLRFIAYAE